MVFLLLFFSVCLQAGVGSEITYSRACAAGQCCNWNAAQDGMSCLVIDNPDCAELLYDNGVAAYRLKEFEKAQAYFSDVAKNEKANSNLKKQSHFNLGNTQVALNEFPEAIKEYEEVLKIDPDDERAKHNLEKVRELLAQQEQEKEQQQNQDGDSQENSDGDGQKQKQKSDGQDSDSAKASSDKQSGDSQDESQQNKNGDQSDSSGGEKPERNAAGDDQGDHDDHADRGSDDQEQDEQKEQFGNGHDETPEEGDDEPQGNNTASQHTKQDEESQQEDTQAMQQAENQELDKDLREEEKQKLRQKFSPKEQWMARLLDRREKADDRANKQLIKATVDKNMTGKYGQNNW